MVALGDVSESSKTSILYYLREPSRKPLLGELEEEEEGPLPLFLQAAIIIQDKLLEMIEYYYFYYKYPSQFSWFELRHFLSDIVMLLLGPWLQRARRRRGRQRLPSFSKEKVRFWTTWKAYTVYACISMAILFQRLRFIFLSVGWFILLGQVLWIILRWLVYIRDDVAVDHFIDFCNIWLRRFVREGNNVLKQRTSFTYVLAFSVVQPARMYYSVYRTYIRHKMRQANRRIVMDAKDRFDRNGYHRFERVLRTHFSTNIFGSREEESTEQSSISTD